MQIEQRSVFGAVRLGYIVVETDKFADWRRFGSDGIGMQLDDSAADTLRFRLDSHECRFLLQRGPAEDVSAIGWEVDDHHTFEVILARLAAHGVPARPGAPEDAALRGADRLVHFPGPNGLSQEIYIRTQEVGAPPQLISTGGFITGPAGLGHVAVTTTKPNQTHGYYGTVFDARLSDDIDETISGVKVKIRFLRVNQRHHSMAIAAVNRLPINPIRTRVQHLNIQAAELGDMTQAYLRVKALGFGIALGIGQHTNDKELSFYAVTPSGFEWEVGWNPLVIDENTWEPTTHQGISLWGHTPENQRLIDRLNQFRFGARSLLRPEPAVPTLAGAGITHV